MECEDHYCFCLFNINIYTQIDTDNIYIYIYKSTHCTKETKGKIAT